MLIQVPPLRQRLDDVELLVEHFMQRLSAEMRLAPLELMHTDWQRLREYHWPGTVRELRNVVERTLLLGRLPSNSLLAQGEHSSATGAALTKGEASASSETTAFPVDWPLAHVERAHIESVLKSVNHNKSAAARILGVSRKTLERKEHLWAEASLEADKS